MIDLFSGTGAFSIVFENNNIECKFANDINKSSEKIYNLNHKNRNFKLADIHTLDVKTDIPKHKILCGGFSCQAFSIAGLQKGFDDERSNVFWKMLEIIDYHKPEIVLIENVKNLKSHDNGNTYKIICENIEKHGYYIKSAILDTCKITDVPQHRERIYIACFRNKEKYDKFNFDFPQIENRKIKDFLETDLPKKYYYTNKLKVYDEIKNNVIKHINENVIYQYRRYYVRENKNNCCPTLTANMGGGGHNVPLILDDNGIRKLTPQECFNLQGFPKDYKLPTDLSDSELYKLAGNAVSIPVVELIVKKLVEVL